MVSFLAAVEGGVAYEQEATSKARALGDREREGGGGGRLGLPIISSLLSLEASGRIRQRDESEESEELRTVRRHTEASLFNLLRHRLIEANTIKLLDRREDLADASPGELVEIEGEIIGNPLQQMVELMDRILPYLGIEDEDVEAQSSRGSKRSTQGKRRPQPATLDPEAQAAEAARQELLQTVRIMRIIRDDLEESHVRDLVLVGREGLKAVLTLGREFLSEQVEDYLLGGRFTVVGKVTRVLAEGESINLTRRTALGISGSDTAREMVNAFTSDESVTVEVADPIVEGPAVQVLPLAVYT
jgi:hypothetical protein